MKWPIGRYNGKRIVGVDVRIIIDVTQWRWLPTCCHGFGMFHWLFWRSWIGWSYESEWRREAGQAMRDRARQLGITRHDTHIPRGPFEEDAR